MAQLVFFVDPAQGVVREMKYSSFTELLSGGFGLPDFAGRKQLSAYVEVVAGLNISACVLFQLPLDSRGQVEEQWDLPFEQLVSSAGKGPDLGAGPVRLSTSIQCSVPWHQAKLWDPKEVPQIFEWLQQIVKQNHLGIEVSDSANNNDAEAEDDFELSGKVGSSIIEPGTESPFGPGAQSGHDMMMPMPGYPMPMMPGMPYGGYDPTKMPAGYFPGMVPGQFPMMPPGQPQPAAPGSEGAPVPDTAQSNDASDASKAASARLEEQYKRQIKMMAEKHHKELHQYKDKFEAKLVQMTQAHERALGELGQELSRLKKKIETLLSNKVSLEEICEAQREQIHDLGKKLTDFRKRAEARERESAEALARKYEETYGQKFQELDKLAHNRMQSQTDELRSSRALIAQLQQEVTDLRRDSIRAVNNDGDDVLSRLDHAGISFIAFHAGAGHMSIPLNDVGTYVENPMAYAARRCGVSEEAYRLWVTHDQDPVCGYQIGASSCGCKIPKVDLPSDFKPGISDRCDKHRSLTADWEHASGYGQ